MVVQEIIMFEGRELMRTYSDEHRYVVREGISYVEAVDPIEFTREYTEGDKIDGGDEDEPTAAEMPGII